MQLKKPLKKPIFFSRKMKTGAWYVAGFVIAFVYFYVYAVNYIRGVRADEIELDPVTNIQDFHQRLRRQSGFPNLRPAHHAPHHQIPLPAAQQKSLRRNDNNNQYNNQRQSFNQQPIHPRLSWDYHNYTSMTTFLRHVSTIYANLTALYSIGQSVQGRELWVMVVSSSPYEHMIGNKKNIISPKKIVLVCSCQIREIHEYEFNLTKKK